jgi:hypothetical protein
MLEEMKLKDIMVLMDLLKGNSRITYENHYVIVRTYSAGVFAGEIKSRNGREVILHNARRLWKWAGAASLSQLAMEGVKDPDNCKFPCEVNKVELLEVIEILECTEKAKKSIKEVPIWAQ